MGVPGAFYMGVGQGTRPESPVWGGRGAIRQQDQVPGSAPSLPWEDQLLGGEVEDQDSRDGRHW